MNTWVSVEYLSDQLIKYLAFQDEHAAWFNNPIDKDEPLLRRYGFDSATWSIWLQSKPPAGKVSAKSMPNLDEWLVEASKSLMLDLNGSVDRQKLVVLSSAMKDQETEDDHRIAAFRLWLATRIWGGGTSDGRAPRYTREGMHTEGFLDHLTLNSAGHWDGTKLKGSGLSYESKWWWSLELGAIERPDGESPYLILDDRVRITLGWLRRYETWGHEGGQVDTPAGTPSGQTSYKDYRDLVSHVASEVRKGRRGSHVDEEKIEWLLFSTTNGEYTTFRGWLKPPGN